MSSQQVRRKFLKYFEERGHALIASSPVVPFEDPTLLFTNAGMNQFKDVFLGKSQREYGAAVSSQKCLRVGGKHNDLENVGHTSRHLTFFEMLGNFSFGDYFKERAIQYAWEVSTEVFGFDPEKIWATVYQDDDEAFALWEKILPAKKIVRLGEKDNFWAMGDTGPCGPCSELYYDRGAKFGSAPGIAEDSTGERYLEFWNLVFMQFQRLPDGKMVPLPKGCIDTGSGLERVMSLKMGVETLFGTDIFRELIAEIEKVSGVTYDAANAALAPAFHVISDHIRSLAFAICDGVQPSNLDRGYVLRKLLRRAVRYGKVLGMQQPFLAKVLPRLASVMGDDYPELRTHSNRIAETLTLEEESFFRTLRRGGAILQTVIDEAKSSASNTISGEEAFRLKDTYGLPLEEIELLAKDCALGVDLSGFQKLEQEAKVRSRSAGTKTAQMAQDTGAFEELLKKHGPSQFVGYDSLSCKAKIVAIFAGGAAQNQLSEGEEGLLLLDTTPFYAEKGGQVGDSGRIEGHQGSFFVRDTKAPFSGLTAQIGQMQSGTLRVGDEVQAAVDPALRAQVARHHTATHLLHWALGQLLGSHVGQAGSLVASDHLRFDFHHTQALSSAQLRQLELLVNERIRTDQAVTTYELDYAEAQKRSEIKQFFGDKYGSRVRVVDAGCCQELCGGTHVRQLGQIGYFRIASEGSIAAGVRRIEAVCGLPAEQQAYAIEDLLHTSASLLKTNSAQLPARIEQLLEENKRLELEMKSWKQRGLRGAANELLSKRKTSAAGVPLLALATPYTPGDLQPLADEIFALAPSLVLLLAAKAEGRCQLYLRVSPDLVQKGIEANKILQQLAPLVQGSGGGKPALAQAGGKDPSGIQNALDKLEQLI